MKFFRKCRMCGRRVEIGLAEYLAGIEVWCPDVDACIATFKAAHCTPPDDELPPFEDPEREQEPDDIWDCSVCLGSGEVFVMDPTGAPLRDFETGAYYTEMCVPCQGTGSSLYPMLPVAA